MEHTHGQPPRKPTRAWQKFEKSLANNPTFPGDLGQRACALIWCRMGTLPRSPDAPLRCG